MFVVPLVIAVHAYTTHMVVPGDTLYGISQTVTGNGDNWPKLYYANRNVIGSNPNLIFPGERLTLKFPKTYGDPKPITIRDIGTIAKKVAPVYHRTTYYSGTLSCNGLEKLWESAGGNSGSAFIAAEIAMAESGGNQYATGPAGERGYWQIHPDHGYLSTYNAYGNARAAVIISDNGSNWSPWTTYTSGAYIGRC